jgi:hypothetical protein
VTDLELDRLLDGAVREHSLIGISVAIVSGDKTGEPRPPAEGPMGRSAVPCRRLSIVSSSEVV